MTGCITNGMRKIFPWLASAAVILSAFYLSYLVGSDPVSNLRWAYLPFSLLVFTIFVAYHLLFVTTNMGCCAATQPGSGE